MKLRRERETGSVPREEDRHRRLEKRRGVETEEKRKLKGEEVGDRNRKKKGTQECWSRGHDNVELNNNITQNQIVRGVLSLSPVMYVT